MRIVLFSSSASRSGGTRQAMYLARGLAGRGHAVTFLLPQGAEIAELAGDLDCRFLPASRADWRHGAEAALGPGPCVVHAFHNKAVKRLAWLGLKWRFRGRKIVCVGYRGVVFRPGNPLPYWSPGIDAFVANSEACASVLRGMGVGAGRVDVIRNGIPVARMECRTAPGELRAALDLPASGLVIGTVAGDKQVKGDRKSVV